MYEFILVCRGKHVWLGVLGACRYACNCINVADELSVRPYGRIVCNSGIQNVLEVIAASVCSQLVPRLAHWSSSNRLAFWQAYPSFAPWRKADTQDACPCSSAADIVASHQ